VIVRRSHTDFRVKSKRRAISLALSGILAVGVGAVLLLGGGGGGSTNGDGGGEGGDAGDLTVVEGVIGSEKVAFFEDEAVRAAFADHGFDVRVEPAGSRQIATAVDLDAYDFAFPGSAPVAERIQRDRGVNQAYAPFHSPMAIASFETIVDILAAEGVAREEADGTWTFDMAAFMELAAADRRWDQLGQDAYPVRKDILVRTTDPRNSNSAAMYLAITSHLANGNRVVQDPAQERAVLPTITDLFLEQGFAATTSDPPFEDYLSQGVGNTPLLFIYEAQFLERVLRDDGSIVRDGDANQNMVLLYPSPTVVSNHTLVPLTDDGDAIGRLLAEDETLQQLAAEHGFRTRRPASFAAVVDERVRDVVPVRTDVVDVIDPPNFETLERLLGAIEQEYQAGGAAAPEDEE
jgi:hypothetical protein